MIALSQSLPTPNTQELFRVVTREDVGAPPGEFPALTAPIAPEPLIPDKSAPTKLTTVIELSTLSERVAVTFTVDNFVRANARQISAVPSCTLVRCTSSQVSPPPLTPVTLVCGVLFAASEEMKARSSSLLVVLEKAAVEIVVLGLELSFETLTSMLNDD